MIIIDIVAAGLGFCALILLLLAVLRPEWF
ncbi:hypothetical protein CLV29_2054 [Naumannella halotolerans]|uniref:K+-transporting ATPase KdpF subunit n=1 Tax=Naumannella halotolerans TaxID=993414 RepID=A0A4R7JA07_9ACTN|nr:hypothetical protein CLV29_2054 [Naumannella halotolerans]